MCEHLDTRRVLGNRGSGGFSKQYTLGYCECDRLQAVEGFR
jgi:hypothetical protein